MSTQSAAAAFPAGDPRLPDDVVSYGPEIADDDTLRLIGAVDGKRILVLGAGGGHAAVTLAGRGAHVIVVDADHTALERARDRAEAHERRLELHHGDLADLAFVRADTVDGALSVYELGRQSDLDRVLRQAHRVLRPDATFVCSLPHPAFLMLDHRSDDPFRIVHSYLDRAGREIDAAVVFPRSVSEVFTSFSRANFRVDSILEPAAESPTTRGPFWSEAMRMVPATLVVRARKEGI